MQQEGRKWSLSPPFEIVSQWGCVYLSGTVSLSGQPPTDSELMSLCLALRGHCISITSEPFSEFPNKSNGERELQLIRWSGALLIIVLYHFHLLFLSFHQCVMQIKGNQFGESHCHLNPFVIHLSDIITSACSSSSFNLWTLPTSVIEDILHLSENQRSLGPETW